MDTRYALALLVGIAKQTQTDGTHAEVERLQAIDVVQAHAAGLDSKGRTTGTHWGSVWLTMGSLVAGFAIGWFCATRMVGA